MVPVAKGKTRITIRLDDEVLDWLRTRVEAAGGGNYQTLINDTLRQIIGSEREPLETVVRRVVRDELRRQPARRRAGRLVAARDGVAVGLREGAHAVAFRQGLTNQPIGVLVGAALPGWCGVAT